MADSEKSFADRLQRGRNLQGACASFVPVFTPKDADLASAPFNNFLSTVEAKNSAAGQADGSYSLMAGERFDLVKTIKGRVTESINYVESYAPWKTLAPKVRMIADKLRGVRPAPPKPVAEPPPGGPAPKPARNTGDQSYEDIAGHLDKFVAAIGLVPAYAPSAVALTVGSFGGQLSSLRNYNRELSRLGPQVSLAKAARSGAYFGEAGLQGKMVAIKKAVRAQYGSASAEFATAKGIKF